jgi:hypothetical protein
LATLVDKRRKQAASNLTQEVFPAPDELVIHVRIGDVVEFDNHSVEEMLHHPTYFYEKHAAAPWHQYVKPLEYYKETSLKSAQFPRVALVAASHVKLRAYPKSCQYLSVLKSYFESAGFENVRLLTGRLPDDDVLFMSSASAFLPSGGTFSMIISKLVTLHGGKVLHPHTVTAD